LDGAKSRQVFRARAGDRGGYAIEQKRAKTSPTTRKLIEATPAHAVHVSMALPNELKIHHREGF